MKKYDIPKPILERVESELVRGESLLWVGQSYPTRFLLGNADKTHPLLATAIGLEILAMVLATLALMLWLAGILFVLLLMTAIFGGIGQQIYAAKNTVYAITNKRAMIIREGEVETFGKNDLQSIIKKTRSNGRGDIIFRKDNVSRPVPTAYGLMLHRNEEKERGFFGIDNPGQVELLLLDTFSELEPDTRRLEEHGQEIESDDYLDDYQVAENQS